MIILMITIIIIIIIMIMLLLLLLIIIMIMMIMIIMIMNYIIPIIPSRAADHRPHGREAQGRPCRQDARARLITLVYINSITILIILIDINSMMHTSKHT